MSRLLPHHIALVALATPIGATAAGRNVVAPAVARRMLEPQVRLDTTNVFYRVDMGLG